VVSSSATSSTGTFLQNKSNKRGGAFVKIKYFIVFSSCLLYLIAAGLFSRSVWFFEAYQWNHVIGRDADLLGSGPGTYDLHKSVWYARLQNTNKRHVNCCNPEMKDKGGWGIFNAILGWQNSATIGSVTSYCFYWIFVTLALVLMRVDEKRVARGQATLWRRMLGKGPRPVVHHTGSISVDGASEDGVDSSMKKGLEPGAERDLQNLTV
jgi:hypothetical protein